MKSDDEDNFSALLREIELVNSSIHSLVDEIEENAAAVSQLHGRVLGFLGQLGEITEQLNMFDTEIEQLGRDSKEVVAESIVLLDGLNQLKSRFMKADFGHHRSSLGLMLEKADAQVTELLEELNHMPLDINRAKNSLEKTRRETEKVNNEVGLLIEQLHMAERLMVYGNRYINREGIYLMDLTIAEDQFYQGNYEVVIEKMRGVLLDVEGSEFDEVFESLKEELGCVLI
jgi:septation ring formation regulator EzrA